MAPEIASNPWRLAAMQVIMAQSLAKMEQQFKHVIPSLHPAMAQQGPA
jgi:hypothetical protein